MSSLGTSSPVSASTFRYLIRCPVARFSWLKLIFSDSDVAGYSATGQVTSDRRRKPFQLARGAMNAVLRRDGVGWIQDEWDSMVLTGSARESGPAAPQPDRGPPNPAHSFE